jgi:hypothetical protein
MDDLNSVTISTVDSPKDFGRGPTAEVKRWLVELSLAKKRMKPWRDKSKKLWDLYHGTSTGRKKNSYNALYANTEILAPSVYNSMPQPDTRRRFAQNDPLGKAVSEVINRSLAFNAETTGFEEDIEAAILDMLIIGRGIARVRYIPDLVQVGDTQQTGIEDAETDLDHEAQEGEENEELAWETVPIEHVKWDKYLCGPGRSYKEIPWWGFEHNLTREELCKRFGDEIGNAIPLNGGPADNELQRDDTDGTYDLFKTAEVWEIWDKDTREVLWISEAYLKAPLKRESDPLGVDTFIPTPNPLRAIRDSDTFEPTSLYDQYREQAEELDRVSTRINKLMTALKARAIYDPSLGSQVAELFRGDDNDMIPADSAIRQLYEAGGIDKAIWFAPIDKIIQVLDSLYKQREECKQVIYELTGIADIMRGSTDAQETKGAQDLKVAFGMTRLSRMQRDVQKYIRNLLAMQAQVICERFSIGTLKQMTQLELPTDAQIMPQRYQMMQQAITAKMQGQQVPPLPPKPTTWEDVQKAMQDDAQRTFRVDIETDSTIAAAQQEDAQDLATVMTAVVTLVKEVGPMVQMGVMPFPAFKELLLMTARKFRMGSAVEDAIDQMQPPQQGHPPVQLQVEQMRQTGKQQEIAAQVQADRERASLDQQTALAEQHAQGLQAQQENALEAQRNQLQAENEAALERMRMANDAMLEKMKAEMQGQVQMLIAAMNNRRAVEVAEIAAGAQLDAAQIGAARAGSEAK